MLVRKVDDAKPFDRVRLPQLVAATVERSHDHDRHPDGEDPKDGQGESDEAPPCRVVAFNRKIAAQKVLCRLSAVGKTDSAAAKVLERKAGDEGVDEEDDEYRVPHTPLQTPPKLRAVAKVPERH